MSPYGPPFGQYRLVHKIADGGMGEIFLAADTRMGRPVAIKRVLERFRSRPDVTRMFEVEATVMSVLRHPHIVRVFESGEIDSVFYIAMEYVHGRTLRQLVDRCRELGESLAPSLVIAVIEKLAGALGYAHGMRGRSGRPMGLVHRDVNPSNLLIGYDGSIKLIDFGIVQTDDELAPDDLEPKGKFAYMSPEQISGERVDQRSDLFSLGICLYEALTLYNPFIHQSGGGDLADAIRSLTVRPPSEHAARLAPFDGIVERALAKNPDARFANAFSMMGELTALRESFPPLPPLSGLMADLFENQKRREDALLDAVQLSSASTITVSQEAMAAVPTVTKIVGEATDAREYAVETRGSVVAFLFVLAVIAAGTTVGAYWTFRVVVADRIAAAESSSQASVVEVAPNEDEISQDDVPTDFEEKDTIPVLGEPSGLESENAIEPIDGISARATPAVLGVTTDPEVRVMLEGELLEERITVSEPRGQILIGKGRHPLRDPFAVILDYEVSGSVFSGELRSRPWSIVRGPEKANLGRTPVTFRTEEETSVLELTNPRERRALRIVLTWDRGPDPAN